MKLKMTMNFTYKDFFIIKQLMKPVKPIGFEAPRGGAYNNRKHLKLETPCKFSIIVVSKMLTFG